MHHRVMVWMGIDAKSYGETAAVELRSMVDTSVSCNSGVTPIIGRDVHSKMCQKHIKTPVGRLFFPSPEWQKKRAIAFPRNPSGMVYKYIYERKGQ